MFFDIFATLMMPLDASPLLMPPPPYFHLFFPFSRRLLPPPIERCQRRRRDDVYCNTLPPPPFFILIRRFQDAEKEGFRFRRIFFRSLLYAISPPRHADFLLAYAISVFRRQSAAAATLITLPPPIFNAALLRIFGCFRCFTFSSPFRRRFSRLMIFSVLRQHIYGFSPSGRIFLIRFRYRRFATPPLLLSLRFFSFHAASWPASRQLSVLHTLHFQISMFFDFPLSRPRVSV